MDENKMIESVESASTPTSTPYPNQTPAPNPYPNTAPTQTSEADLEAKRIAYREERKRQSKKDNKTIIIVIVVIALIVVGSRMLNTDKKPHSEGRQASTSVTDTLFRSKQTRLDDIEKYYGADVRPLDEDGMYYYSDSDGRIFVDGELDEEFTLTSEEAEQLGDVILLGRSAFADFEPSENLTAFLNKYGLMESTSESSEESDSTTSDSSESSDDSE